MKKRISYQDFQRRQKLAEADLVIAERTWQRELGYIKGLGIKQTLINEAKEQIAPPGSTGSPDYSIYTSAATQGELATLQTNGRI